MMTKEGSTKIVNIMTLGAGVPGRGHISQIVKMHNLLYSQVQILVMMTKESFPKL